MRLGTGRQGAFGSFARGTETTQGPRMGGQILAITTFKVLSNVIDQTIVEIFSPQMGITGRGLDFKNAIFDGQERYVKGTSPQIKNQNILFAHALVLIQSVGNGRRGGFIDDAHHIQTSNRSRIFGGGSLTIIKVGRDGNHGVFDWFAQIGFGNFLHFGQDHGRDFFSLELFGFSLVLHFHERCSGRSGRHVKGPMLKIGLDGRLTKFASQETFGIKDSVGGIHGRLRFGRITNQTLRVVEGDVGRSRAIALVIGNNLHTIILPNTDTGIGRSQINSNGISVVVERLSHFFKVSSSLILLNGCE
mmetsp:Transcript_7571/g.15800  ORF Transcript_7571/g.15800 Transcript_7571/m.15800 type:complete len:304 (+) Transcript_7571:60-971(+)